MWVSTSTNLEKLLQLAFRVDGRPTGRKGGLEALQYPAAGFFKAAIEIKGGAHRFESVGLNRRLSRPPLRASPLPSRKSSLSPLRRNASAKAFSETMPAFI